MGGTTDIIGRRLRTHYLRKFSFQKSLNSINEMPPNATKYVERRFGKISD